MKIKIFLILITLFIGFHFCINTVYAEGKIGFINGNNIQLREKNSIESKVLEILHDGDQIIFLEKDNKQYIFMKKDYNLESDKKPIIIKKGEYELLFNIIKENNRTVIQKFLITKNIRVDATNAKFWIKYSSDENDVYDYYKFIKIKTKNQTEGWIKNSEAEIGFEGSFRSAVHLFRSEYYEDALKKFNQALYISPKEINALLYRGKCYFYLKNYKNAVEDYNTGLFIEPTNIDLLFNRGESYIYLGRYEDAIKDFDSVIKIKPSFDGIYKVYNLRGRAKTYTADYASALNDFEKTITFYENFSEVFFNIACLYSLQKDVTKSCQYLNKAVSSGFWKWDLIQKEPHLNNIRSSGCYNEVVEIKQQKDFLQSVNILQLDRSIPVKDLDHIKLKKIPFTLTFILNNNKECSMRINASENNNMFHVKQGTSMASTPFFGWGSGMTWDLDKQYSSLYTVDWAHHYIYYESEKNMRARLIKKLSDTDNLLAWDIKEIENFPIKNYTDKKIFILMYNDKNMNGILDMNEFIRFSIEFVD